MDNSKYCLISVSDKDGISDFAKSIAKLGYKIISTGGTLKHLQNSGLHLGGVNLIPIEQITGNPESFDGRMKTISFQIESGILFDRKNPEHVKQAKELNILPIDLVVCNLYPFEKENSIENIDVGGPTMIRSAAKNYQNVIAIVDPKDYQIVSDALISKKADEEFRRKLAAKAFWHLSFYDSQVARFFNRIQFPEELTIPLKRFGDLRYGENPHQKATFYLEPGTNSPLKNLKWFWGRELSLVNLTDINAGLESIRSFGKPCAVVIKHNTPCGIALGENSSQALKRAIEADPESAFGGVIILNKSFDLKSAKIIASFKDERRGNIDIIAAPKIEKNALDLLKKVRKTMGVYEFGDIPKQIKNETNLKWIEGGLIVQTPDIDLETGFSNWEVVTKIKPTEDQLAQMKIAWLFLTKMRSNAVIVVDKDLPMTRGIGTGQTSRVRATKIALEQSDSFCQDAILASDSFFPFGDSVKEAAKHGIGAIIQQGDSINDALSVDEANKAGIPMIFTHRRAFWH
ncbi:bifunctional phosphoribosylaminoimidazolecarboxamide formyltransferase/IMP cyclohydrolase [Candidatus Daviesbacteria bacterium]|nr:bifunctional phosphoribosylaminoimidazolecarboxamide formyltransferase/IMP cyclohydrolase [Candidatus Daviesbacteria bacterium]